MLERAGKRLIELNPKKRLPNDEDWESVGENFYEIVDDDEDFDRVDTECENYIVEINRGLGVALPRSERSAG